MDKKDENGQEKINSIIIAFLVELHLFFFLDTSGSAIFFVINCMHSNVVKKRSEFFF